jgi:RIO-like serine/threonine protein kinase
MTDDGDVRIVRDLSQARPGCRGVARLLARREARALERLAGIDGVPALIDHQRDRLTREYLAGQPMHEYGPDSRTLFRNALRLLRRIHRAGVAHNDLAKEANWICDDQNRIGIVDFQLASCCRHRSRRFRRLAREDLRHLLKHKACYMPDALTARQRALLANPSLAARLWRRLFKPPYHLLTRTILRWPERIGAAERQRRV